jgi:hypothetical protein
MVSHFGVSGRKLALLRGVLVVLQGDIYGSSKARSGQLQGACPQGATEPHHCRVAARDKGHTIACERRLALARLGGSESVNITLKDY